LAALLSAVSSKMRLDAFPPIPAPTRTRFLPALGLRSCRSGGDVLAADEHLVERQLAHTATPFNISMTSSLVMTHPKAARMHLSAASCSSGPSMVSTQSSITNTT
jgi:hypothetical protein